MNRILDAYMCHDPKITIKDLEDVEQEAYSRGYLDAETINEFYKSKIVLLISHTVIATVFFIMGLLYTTK